MMKKAFLTLGTLLILLVAFSSCKNNTYEAFNTICDTSNVKFDAVINPIIKNNCVSCHYSSSPFGGGINLEGYPNVKDNYVGILSATKSGKMPPSGSPLDACSITKIQTWVNQGANNN